MHATFHRRSCRLIYRVFYSADTEYSFTCQIKLRSLKLHKLVIANNVCLLYWVSLANKRSTSGGVYFSKRNDKCGALPKNAQRFQRTSRADDK